LETAIRRTEDSLANFVSADESSRLSGQLGEQRSHLDATMAEWEQVSEQIEAIA
jgi:hypothetical protein